MKISSILQLLLEVAEKASQIATVIRKEKTLLELLIEEKPAIEKNNQFFQDFKTLADVLIQETVRHFIGKKIPNLAESIYGEESNTFTNAIGDSIIVKVCQTPEETKDLLKRILNGNGTAASLLTEAIHSFSQASVVPSEDLDVDIDISDCGVWIDPIDATGQYIKGEIGVQDEYGLIGDGLQCVAILIGMFQKSSGRPLLGVAVQPFAWYSQGTNSWTSQTVWGICHEKCQRTSFQPSKTGGVNPPRIVISKSESEQVQKALLSKYKLISASGAGYKILVTVLGLANAYVLSHRSIYRWDCCALHAILLAMGGGIVSFKHAREAVTKSQTSLLASDLEHLQVNYAKAAGAIASRRCSLPDNAESLPGIIAYRSEEDALAILGFLK
ncbi:inositol polyphosphate 1-phosphatase [Plakobranchus ocellatus]|uniref:Inositol polyphosphate 1-phosphatase n=1 Tax=Plakobranchus ocellatus TaxID=259542 RepID=A0AAV4AIF1_9GAST|nr:inositol polyphosphate 1-phosphatase [Plakobranchus ocellatus]